jgi:hypothetical protein
MGATGAVGYPSTRAEGRFELYMGFKMNWWLNKMPDFDDDDVHDRREQEGLLAQCSDDEDSCEGSDQIFMK